TAQGKPVITSYIGGALEHLPEASRTAIPVASASVVFDVSLSLDRELGHRWHDPDLSAAVEAMQKLYRAGKKQNESARLPFDAATCGQKIASRLATLGGRA